jgi:hypothetical protein
MRPDEQKSGAEGAMWDALLANLDDEDREHAKRRVFESIEQDRARARTNSPDDGYEEDAAENP